MKIKRKVQKTLPQLIEWGFKNGIVNKEYFCNEDKEKSVIFNLSGWAEFSDEFSYIPDETFTVTTEEEITEDTVIPKMLLRGRYNGYYEIEDCELGGFNENLLQAYILNDDLTMTLIWRDGKLVE